MADPETKDLVRQVTDTTDRIEAFLAVDNLAALSMNERAVYLNRACSSLGLNPLTRPIRLLALNGKLQPYATKDATDQLRRANGISTRVLETITTADVLLVRVEVTDKTGRRDEDIGCVPIGGLKGEALANAQMKCVTKAKRRATLSISGLGFLDESELDTVPGARPVETPVLAERVAPLAPTSGDLKQPPDDIIDAEVLDAVRERQASAPATAPVPAAPLPQEAAPAPAPAETPAPAPKGRKTAPRPAGGDAKTAAPSPEEEAFLTWTSRIEAMGTSDEADATRAAMKAAYPDGVPAPLITAWKKRAKELFVSGGGAA